MARGRREESKRVEVAVPTVGVISHNFRHELQSLNRFVHSLIPVAAEHDDKDYGFFADLPDSVMGQMEKIVVDSARIAQSSTAQVSVDTSDVRPDMLPTEALKALFPSSGLGTSPKLKFDVGTQTRTAIEGLVKRELPYAGLPQTQWLYRGSLVMLVSCFDNLLSQLLRYYWNAYPASLQNKEAKLTVKELQGCDSIDDALSLVVEKEVDKLLHESLETQLKYFEEYLRIDVQRNVANWVRVGEAVERRNLIVHNDGRFSSQYLRLRKDLDLPYSREGSSEMQEGFPTVMRDDYFPGVLAEVLVAGVALAQSCWRKWDKSAVRLADWDLNSCMYFALREGQFDIVEKLGLLCKNCKFEDEQRRLMALVNYCISLKSQGKKDELAKELKQLDVSVLSPTFRAAIHALKGDKKEFYRILPEAIRLDNLQEESLRTWPLFADLREDAEFDKRVRAAIKASSSTRRRKT